MTVEYGIIDRVTMFKNFTFKISNVFNIEIECATWYAIYFTKDKVEFY